MKVSLKTLALVFGFLILVASPAAAQQPATGTLRGQLADEFGGVIVGATVTATGPTGVPKSATTGGDGSFQLAGLAPGKYTVRAVAPGFALGEHADGTFNANSMNSRNPSLRSRKRPPFQFRQYSGSLSGTIVPKKASFFFELERGETDDNDLVNATVLDPATLLPVPFNAAVLTPA